MAPAITDEQLVGRIARGDRDAFDELYRRTAPWLALRLHRRCADEDIVAEVMQDAYVAVWRASASFAGGGSAAGWLWTIAARRLIDAFRRRGRADELVVASVPESAVPSAEDEALHGLGQERMLLLIEDLSDDQRQVLTLKYAFDFSNGEVAGILGKTEGAVKALQHRAFATLHRSLSAAHVA